jgi:dienelactone hydrolase
MANTTSSSIHRENIFYKHDGVEYEGSLAYDNLKKGRRPGILIAHAWMGLDSFARLKAVQLARLGYVAFALDMYGGGKIAKDTDEAGKLITDLRADRSVIRARAQAGLKVLREQRLVESRSIAAIGYCFGGCVALELARGGADLRGVVSFHGLLDADKKLPTDKITSPILALHGAHDQLVPPKQVSDFQKEMTAADADWQLITYGTAAHAFTNPDAGNDISTGLAYNSSADTRSWNAMKFFLEEVFD